jgi:hypothetical protein
VPTFVHLAPAPLVSRIRHSGIARGRWGVFCMPVLPDYDVTHQWARELRRRGQRTFVAIAFWLPDDELFELGRYHTPHQTLTAAQAVAAFRALPDPQGYQVIVPRAIHSSELRAVRPVSHVVGWRYFPGSHGRRPCPCDWCSRGLYGARRIRARFT